MRHLLISAFSVLLVINIHAQAPQKRSQSIGFNITINGDHFDEMTLQQLTSRSNEFQMDAVNLDGYSVSYIYEEVSTGLLGLTYSRKSLNGKYTLKSGINASFSREPMLEYAINSYGDADYHSITFCVVENEVNLNLAFLRSFKLSNRLEASIGPDASLGTTFNDQFVLLEEFSTGEIDEWGWSEVEFRDTYFSAESSKFNRLGLNAGLSYKLGKNFSANLEGVFGRGTQFIRNHKRQDFSFVRIISSIHYNF